MNSSHRRRRLPPPFWCPPLRQQAPQQAPRQPTKKKKKKHRVMFTKSIAPIPSLKRKAMKTMTTTNGSSISTSLRPPHRRRPPLRRPPLRLGGAIVSCGLSHGQANEELEVVKHGT